jgi:hypothetical protein
MLLGSAQHQQRRKELTNGETDLIMQPEEGVTLLIVLEALDDFKFWIMRRNYWRQGLST